MNFTFNKGEEDSVESDVRDAVTVVKVTKQQLRGTASQELFEELLHRLDDMPHLVLDLSECVLIDSLGLGVLVKLAKGQKQRGRTFAICSLNSNVRKTFVQLHLHKVIPVFQDAEHARKGLR